MLCGECKKKADVPFQIDDCECGNAKLEDERYCEECADALRCCQRCGKRL